MQYSQCKDYQLTLNKELIKEVYLCIAFIADLFH